MTHEHSDHIAGLGPFSRRYDVPVYANLPTWDAMNGKVGAVATKNARVFTNGQDFYIGDMGIRPFSTPHDSASSVGYSLFYKGKQFTYMTDIGCFSASLLEEAKGADLVFFCLLYTSIPGNAVHPLSATQAGTQPQLPYHLLGGTVHVAQGIGKAGGTHPRPMKKRRLHLS